MTIQPDKHSLEEKAGPHEARTKDDLEGIDDIGLPSGIQPEEVGTLDEVKPDPAKIEKHEDKS